MIVSPPLPPLTAAAAPEEPPAAAPLLEVPAPGAPALLEVPPLAVPPFATPPFEVPAAPLDAPAVFESPAPAPFEPQPATQILSIAPAIALDLMLEELARSVRATPARAPRSEVMDADSNGMRLSKRAVFDSR